MSCVVDNEETMKPGTRVRLRDVPIGLRLGRLTGAIEEFLPSEGYYIVRLDEAAFDLHADGTEEELWLSREAGDNLIPEPHSDHH
ncbi:hypothetical protein BH23CHL1_BH23CHL1_22220 [soil metagenome]